MCLGGSAVCYRISHTYHTHSDVTSAVMCTATLIVSPSSVCSVSARTSHSIFRANEPDIIYMAVNSYVNNNYYGFDVRFDVCDPPKASPHSIPFTVHAASSENPYRHSRWSHRCFRRHPGASSVVPSAAGAEGYDTHWPHAPVAGGRRGELTFTPLQRERVCVGILPGAPRQRPAFSPPSLELAA